LAVADPFPDPPYDLGRRDGHDHLTLFDTLEQLADLLRRSFPQVPARTLQYRLSGDFEPVERIGGARSTPSRCRYGSDYFSVRAQQRRTSSKSSRNSSTPLT
jgi:hypothetical protein